jgi:2-keto-4-pentenoate hydratase
VKLDTEQHTSAAKALFAAETNRVPIEPISISYPNADIDDAYRIAMKVTELKVQAGGLVKGHKIGLTSKPMQQLAGTNEPDFGTLVHDWFIPEGSTLEVRQLNRPLVEVELAFVLRAGLSGTSVNAADVIRATDFVMPAIEIVDTRYAGRGNNLLIDSIADTASCGRVVLGARPMRLTDIDLRREGAALYKNGAVEETGVGAAVMGNPVNAVVWLANKLGEFGVAIEAGQVILSGSFIKAVLFATGDTITAIFDTLGDVSFATA